MRNINILELLSGIGFIGMIIAYVYKTNKLKKNIMKLERMLQAHLIEKGEE